MPTLARRKSRIALDMTLYFLSIAMSIRTLAQVARW